MTAFSNADVPGAPASVPGAPSSVPGGQSITGSTPLLNLSGGDFTLRSGPIVVNMIGFAEIESKTQAYVKGIENKRHEIAQELAKQMQAYARANAPWQDQTGDARDGLTGVYIAEQAANISAAIIAHTVPYGIYLETMNGGAFRILFPTVLYFARKFQSLASSSDFGGEE